MCQIKAQKLNFLDAPKHHINFSGIDDEKTAEVLRSNHENTGSSQDAAT